MYIRLICAQYKPEYFDVPSPPITAPQNQTNPPLPPNSPIFAYHRSDKSVTLNVLDSGTQFDALGSHDDDVHVTVPRPNSRCTSDTDVGRIVAGLSTTITLIMGILSILTTGFWSTVSFLA